MTHARWEIPYPLESALLKLERAQEHLDSLDAAVQRWLKTDAYRVTDEVNADSGDNVVHIQLLREPDAAWGTVIGDCVHNLRGALDNLMFGLAEISHGAPLTGDPAKSSEFPIYGSRAPNLPEIQKRVGLLPPGAVTFIESLQPHLRGNDHANDPLWLVGQLDNIDKHRSVHLAVLAHRGTGIGRPGENVYIERMSLSPTMLAEDRAIRLGEYRAFNPYTNKRMQMRLGITMDVTFDAASTIAAGQPVVPLLRDLNDYVSTVVFSPLLLHWG